MIDKKTRLFGKTDDGKEVVNICLKNNCGMEVNILTYAGIVRNILFNGINTVLGYPDLEGYLKGTSFIGSFVGRYANRLGNSSFSLDGHQYNIPANEGKNHLHGTYCNSVMDYSFDNDSLVLSLVSPDGEEGYPGTVKIKVIYTLTEENSLIIHYLAETDKPTVINLTNHSYFNLNGDGGTILEHTLQLDSDSFTVVDSQSIPTGEIRSVAGTPMDFREPKKIGRDINSDYDMLNIGQGYDHNYVIKADGSVKRIATLTSDKSGISMECYTDQCGVQLYSGNFVGKDQGASFPKNGAVCLETQHYPDSPNRPGFPTTRLDPGQIFNSTTIYKFFRSKQI